MKTYKRLISIDPGLTCSGWALFDLKTMKLQGVGKIKSKKQGVLNERLQDFQEKVLSLFNMLNLSPSDILVCEEATTMIDPRSTLIVEQVRCVFEVLAREKGVKVPGRINPRTVQYEIMGLKGKQIDRENVKLVARNSVKQLYSGMLKDIGFPVDKLMQKTNQDIVDSILIGALGVSRVKSFVHAKCKIEEMFSSNYGRRRC